MTTPTERPGTENRGTATRETFLFAGLLGFVLVWFFAPSIWRGEVIALGDVPDQFLPWREFLASEISEGRIPLWNRFSFCGAPFLANMQSAVLYPPDRFFDMLLSPPRAIMAGMFFHLWLGSLFLYLLARRWGACSVGAFAGALGFALGGFHAIHLWGGNLLTVTSAVYLPGHLLMVSILADRLRNEKPLGLVPSGAALLAASQVLSGHAQMTFYGFVFVLTFALSLSAGLGGKRLRFFSVLAMVALIGALLAAPQILPTLEYGRLSSRSGVLPFLPATEFSFGWEILPTFLFPEYLGTRADMNTPLIADTYWGDWKNWSAVYVGALPACGFLYLIGVIFRDAERRRRFLPWVILALVGLILSLGRNTPVYWYVHHYLPPFGKFRAPSKFLPGLVVPVCVLGSVGVSMVLARLSQEDRKEKSGKDPKWLILLGLGCLGYLAVTVLASAYPSQTPVSLVCRDVVRTLSLLSIAWGGVAFGFERGFGPRWIAAALVLAVCFDMGPYFKKYLFTRPPDVIERFPADFLEKNLPPGDRFLVTPDVPNMAQAIPRRLPSAGGYDPFQLGIYVEAFRKIGFLKDEIIPDAWSPPPGWAARLGASQVLTGKNLREPGLRPLARSGPWKIYEVVDPAPLVEWIPEDSTPESRDSEVSWEWEGADLRLSGTAPGAGNLLIRQVYAPGWTALEASGDRRPVALGEDFWQNLSVPKGDFDFVLSYSPPGWRLGKALFIPGVIGLGLTLLAGIRARRKTYDRS